MFAWKSSSTQKETKSKDSQINIPGGDVLQALSHQQERNKLNLPFGPQQGPSLARPATHISPFDLLNLVTEQTKMF